jgi:undecaprenyl pyrophosphate phosphatase UppP
LLAGHFLGFESKGRTFEVVIQLGAILALASVYAAMVCASWFVPRMMMPRGGRSCRSCWLSSRR